MFKVMYLRIYGSYKYRSIFFPKIWSTHLYKFLQNTCYL